MCGRRSLFSDPCYVLRIVVNEGISEQSLCFIVVCVVCHTCVYSGGVSYVCRSDIVTALITKLSMTPGKDKLGMSLGMYIIIFCSY